MAEALPADDGSAPEVGELPRRRDLVQRSGDALGVLLMSLGSVMLALLLGLDVYLASTLPLRDSWTHWIGAPPFRELA
jgi:hypothetical protein